MALGPEQARGWLSVLLPLLQQAGPVLSLFLLLIGGFTIHWLQGRLHEARQVNAVLYERLLKVSDEYHDELRKLIHCQPER
jgi:hypothetical protein